MESSCLRFHGHWAFTDLRVACLGDKLPRGLQKCDPLYTAAHLQPTDTPTIFPTMNATLIINETYVTANL
eukprot:2763391-Ditylum_brightwellii.AAC.1